MVTSVQFSHVGLFVTPWTAACQASLSTTNSQSLLKLMSIKSVISSNHLILYRPLLLLPSILPSIRVFFNESVLHIRWPKYWSFSFSISPSNEYSGLISFRMDWFDLLAVQGTLKSLLQHHSSEASILRRSALFVIQLSHPYVTTRKTIVLTRQTFVGKVMSLLFNMLSRLVIAFLPRNKHLLKLWSQKNHKKPRSQILKWQFFADPKETHFWRSTWQSICLQSTSIVFILFFNLFFNWRIIAFNVVLVSAVQRRESVITIHIYIPSLLSLPPTPPPSHPSRSSQSTRLGSPC